MSFLTAVHRQIIGKRTARSKAAAELLAQAYARSYGLRVQIARPNNVVGPGQHVEKLVPAVLLRLEQGQRVPVEGDGEQRRGFLHVEDAVSALELIRTKGDAGIYNIGASTEHTVLDVVRLALEHVLPGERLEKWVHFVADRPFQDRRYAVDCSKLRALGWAPSRDLSDAVRRQTAPSVTSDGKSIDMSTGAHPTDLIEW